MQDPHDRAMDIADQLQHLIELEVPQLPDDSEPAARLLRYSVRILNSRIAGGLVAESQSAEIARRRLVQAGRPTDALALSEAIGRLHDGQGMRDLPAALQMLCALMHSTPRVAMSSCAGAALLTREAPLAPPMPPLQHAHVTAPEPDVTPRELGAAPLTNGGKGASSSGATAGGTDEASEKVLVRDVLFVLQNIDGTLIKWDAARDAFASPPDMRLPRASRQLVSRLCELGWLFRQIDGYIKAQASPGGGGGLVAQAFCHALQAELGEWYQLLAVLDAQRQSELSLVQLLVWSHEPMQRMLTMTQLVRSCGGLKGGALSVGIHRHERNGDPDVSTYVRHLLRQALSPLFEMIRRWVLHGELHDPHREFFVEQRPVPLHKLWHERYVLVEAMLPCFVSAALGEQVLLVGKAINFIRLSCADSQWSLLTQKGADKPAAEAVASCASSLPPGCASSSGGSGSGGGSGGGGASWLGELEYGQEEKLETFVRSAAARANARLLELLFGRYRLREHCAHIKSYLLLGKGDFVQYLMEHLAPQLSRPSSQLHRHQLLSLVESAVRSCTAAAEGHSAEDTHELLLRHLDVALPKDPSSSGWDAFSLDYRVEPPVAEVLSAEAMARYRKMFTFLWKLKRVEHALTSTWRKHGTAAHVLRLVRGDRSMHGCHLLRNEMIHFVYNLQYYLMFEVLECSWQTLLSELESASDLDALLHAHTSFLDAIVQKALLAPGDELIYEALKAVFEAVLQFSKAQDALYLQLLEQQAAARQHASAVEANLRAGQWGDHGMPAHREPPPASLDPHFRQQLERHAVNYRRRFAEFFRLVSQHASLDLAFLSFRLDFNLFYETSQLQAEAAIADLSPDASPVPGSPMPATP